MLKKYQSKSHIAINVVLESGKSAHVSFSAKTDGGSVYYTEDTSLQDALERHHMYGKLFTLVSSDSTPEADPVDESPSMPDDGTRSVVSVEVSCLDDAKDYLVEKFGISRTKLRSEKAIRESGESHGVEFVGI